MANEQQGQVGKVVQVMGAVVDIAFSDDQELPAIYNAIHVKDEEGTVPVDVICETMQHLGDGVVRTVAMSSTDGMVRGMKAVDTGRAIAAPVGDGCLGRIFNVLGQTVDNDDTKVPASDYWPIHRPAPAFKDQSPATEIFETGIKVVDLLTEEATVLPSKGELRKLVAAGGLSIDKEKVASPDDLVTTAQLIADRYLLVQRGKKNYYLFKSPVKASFFMIQPATPNSKKKFGFSELHLLK